MKKIILPLLLFIAFISSAFAQNQDSLKIDYEKIEKSLIYKTGIIEFPSGNASLNVPKGFKFLDAKQTQYVLKDLWGNPEDTTVLGSIVPENKGVMNDNSWLFVINYQEDGYVKDDDAQDINYDDLLKDIQEEMRNENPDRTKQGFETIELIGWASKPFYDEKLKVLHWAKEIKFGQSKENTLNYDLRVLGRKGMYTISAVSSMHELAEVKRSIPNIINSIKFKEGQTYFNFDESTDNVAAWTIGGLVAGKVLAKVGLFAVIAKFGKVIFIALLAAFAGAKKFIFGKKDQVLTKPKEDEELAEETKAEEE